MGGDVFANLVQKIKNESSDGITNNLLLLQDNHTNNKANIKAIPAYLQYSLCIFVIVSDMVPILTSLCGFSSSILIPPLLRPHEIPKYPLAGTVMPYKSYLKYRF